MIACDTNVLVRLASSADPKHEVALAVKESYSASDETICVFPQVIYEFFVVATKSLKANGLELPASEAEEFIASDLRDFALVPDTEKTFEAWRDLTARYAVSGNPNHDLRIVAAMLAAGGDRLLTFNAKHFRRFAEIEVVDPHDVAGSSDGSSSHKPPSTGG